MVKIEVTEKHKAYTEDEAKEFIEKERIEALNKGYIIKKAGYEYKTKKQKGEIVQEVWITTITKVFNEVWD